MLDHTAGLIKNQLLIELPDLPIFHKAVEAVYVFFVLSGFLIVRIIYLEKAKGTFSAINFYARRALRILPLYFAVGLFGLIYYHLLLPWLNISFDNQYSFREGLVMIFTFRPNVLSTYSPGGILEVLWSIGVEEQFYLFIIPLLFFVKYRWILPIVGFSFLTTVFLFQAPQFTFFRDYGLTYHFLLLGGFISIAHEKGWFHFILKSKVIKLIITLAFISIFVLNYNDSVYTIEYNLFISAIFGLFILLISTQKASFVITSPTLNYLGKISYGIYMLHVIVLNFVVFILLRLDLQSSYLNLTLGFILTLAVTLIMSGLSYRYFESYFLKKKALFRTGQLET